MSEKGRKDKNQNIQVFVRLRPLNQRERDIRSLGVVEVQSSREVVVRQSQQTCHTKRFTFDKAFAPHATQLEVYQEVVSPLIEEVLAGYNCTVFAYGQTGTGKTHTMVGENTGDESNWQSDPLAGIIPRALSQLFDELRITNTEYTVRVSYLELYNEELFDLLSSSEDNSKLRIYEDVTRKGSNIVNGLEEITVHNKNQVYKIMAQGQDRKRVASTLMNAQSSRSHTVFTIVVHMKENSPEGEEFVKIGKLNLVDLAGSENISKAGSDNPAKKERARECVNINQSLLTLGRVITALVERHPHIPYRESKLTRILQESLGGRTKTSIIATISPGHKDLEETMSTLEYAHRAKNIQNKPEINQKMTKKAILKEFVDEIDRLKKDLHAAREKNGVYLPNETFAEMTLKHEQQLREIQELLLKKKAMEDEKEKIESLFTEQLEKNKIELKSTKHKLYSTIQKLNEKCNLLTAKSEECAELNHLVTKHQETEEVLGTQAKEILKVADVAVDNLANLHNALEKRISVEGFNSETKRKYREAAAQLRARLASDARVAADNAHGAIAALRDAGENIIEDVSSQQDNIDSLEQLASRITDETQHIKQEMTARHDKLKNVIQSRSASLKTCAEDCVLSARDVIDNCTKAIYDFVQIVGSCEIDEKTNECAGKWSKELTKNVQLLRDITAQLDDQTQKGKLIRCQEAESLARDRQRRFDSMAEAIRANITAIKQHKKNMDEKLHTELENIKIERQSNKEYIEQWVKEETLRIEKFAKMQTDLLEDKLTEKIRMIREEKENLEAETKRVLETEERELELLNSLLERVNEAESLRMSGEETHVSDVERFKDELTKVTTCLDNDVAEFACDVTNTVSTVNRNICDTMEQSKVSMNERCSVMLTSIEAKAKMNSDVIGSTCDNIIEENGKFATETLIRIQTNTQNTIADTKNVQTKLDSLIQNAKNQYKIHKEALDHITEQMERLQSELSSNLKAQDQLESACLEEGYKNYSPTGKTPLRCEYRYPRSLAETSPHERLLARYRAALREQINGDHEDCILVESDDQMSSVSSLSEDSAVVPAAPTTPPMNGDAPRQDPRSVDPKSAMPPPPTPPTRPPPLTKSTSETDIYTMKKEQSMGKENSLQTVPTKGKPSKLPALAAFKRPLVERNSTAN